MIEELLEHLNMLLLQHPHLLHVMHILFWVKYWLLVGIFWGFVYVVYKEDKMINSGVRKRIKSKTETSFIA